MTIIHGSDTVTSRNYFLTLKGKEANAVLLDGASLTLTNLTQALEGQGLFGEKSAIFIDELLSKRKPSKEIDAIVEFLAKQKDAVTLWESKDLTPKQIISFKEATIKQFKLPTSLFAFLDSVKPGNTNAMLVTFHTVLEEQEPEMVFFMLIRQVRMLIALSQHSQVASESSNQISEVKRLASWQKTKLEKQAKLFTQEKLLNLYNQLFTLEKQLKTGTLSLPLPATIDFLLASL